MGTGRCTDELQTGLPLGSDCDTTTDPDPCSGWCMATNGTKGMCTGFCTLGVYEIPGSCGSDSTPGSPQDAVCLFTLQSDNGFLTQGVGDLAVCGRTCDCTDDCLSEDHFCIDFEDASIVGSLGRKGYCAPNPGGNILDVCESTGG